MSNEAKMRGELVAVKDYAPELVTVLGGDKAYFKMLVEVEKCPLCEKWMIVKPRSSGDNLPFPRWIPVQLRYQARRAGWEMASGVEMEWRTICQSCVDAGKVTFKCELCEERRTTDKIQDQFGDPPDYLCVKCYESASARVYNEKAMELSRAHRYDYYP